MKIGLTGSHGSGKSTLLKAIPEGLVDRKITEVSRTLIEKLGFNPLVGSSTYWEKLNFEKMILAEQIAQEKKPGGFITDRTVFDVLAYSSTLLNNLDYGDLYLTAHAHYWNNPYDLVVYIPVEFEMEKDGVRPESERYRREIDEAILTILTNSKVPYVKVTGTVEERVSQVCREIERVQALR